MRQLIIFDNDDWRDLKQQIKSVIRLLENPNDPGVISARELVFLLNELNYCGVTHWQSKHSKQLCEAMFELNYSLHLLATPKRPIEALWILQEFTDTIETEIEYPIDSDLMELLANYGEIDGQIEQATNRGSGKERVRTKRTRSSYQRGRLREGLKRRVFRIKGSTNETTESTIEEINRELID